ncbi:MAG TPA: GMC family oxidoreductase [Bacteriovoracaceae bacterium]|nr:GMC family oxidoreductase [Bacteriovoracaceae bacterium]
MKQHDLLSSSEPRVEAVCDVCIIGAGAAGLYLATRLAAKGQSVVILEAGGRVCSDAASLGVEPVFTGDVYPGATLGRAFGLGGSTSRWGGLLVPHSRHDVRSCEFEEFDPWRLIVSKVENRTNAVLSNLGFCHQSDFEHLPKDKLGGLFEILRAQGLDTIAAQFLPFNSRNLVFLLKGRSTGTQNIQIFLNAVSNTWRLDTAISGHSMVNTVGAISANGNTVMVKAKHVVVAAGAIESARILLEIKRSAVEPVISETAEVGCNLSDHLSCRIADFKPTDYRHVASLFGPRFIRGYMRSFRFVENKPPSDAPRCFTHFIFDINNPAFHLVKEALSALQAHRLPNVSVAQFVAGGAGLFSLAFSRYVRSVLFIPEGTAVHLQLDIEQVPMSINAVSLTDEIDRYGRPVARINWRINNVDYANIQQTAARILSTWPGPRGGLPDLVPVFIRGSSPKPHDAYHPVGTCRLGIDTGAVVDTHLRVQGTDNLWVLSTGVLPSAGTANPTFTMLCLGDELADRLTLELNRHVS